MNILKGWQTLFQNNSLRKPIWLKKILGDYKVSNILLIFKISWEKRIGGVKWSCFKCENHKDNLRY